MPLRRVRSRTGRRRALVAWLALAPALAGPGALVASVALLAAGGVAHAHHLSVQPDLGHDDIVLCHEGAPAAVRGPSLVDGADCPDDHRLHVARADRMVPGGELRSALRPDAAPAAAVLPRAVSIAAPAARVPRRAPCAAEPPAPAPLERSTVLQI
jgi:hypothetical protein